MKERPRQKIYYKPTTEISKRELKERREAAKCKVQESQNRAKEVSSNNAAVLVKMDFHKHVESSRKRWRIFHKKMNSKLKELEREKESLRRKTERLYKRTQTVKKTTTKFTPKRIVRLTKQEICSSRVKGIRKQVLYGKVLTKDYV